MPDGAWLHRHHAMIGLLFVEAVGLAVFSAVQGSTLLHSAAHAAGLFAIGAAAILFERRRRAASVLVSFGLVTACALLVHIWDGAIEGHFLFFVTIVVLALYEDWIPFLVAAAYVVLHHGIAGAIDPSAVYNHPAAVAHPWRWAAIHGAFVVAAGLASVAAWRLNESLRAQEQESFRRALESEERFRGAFEGAPIGMALFRFATGGRGDVIQVNEAMREITGHSHRHLRESSFRDVVHPDDSVAVTQSLDDLLTGDSDSLQLDLRFIHARGHEVWVSASVSLLNHERDGLGYAIGQVQDITERRLVAEELIHQALHDPLTELGNRRSLLADLELGLLEATESRPLMLLVFDLDGFKTYNDSFGHPAGDALLMRIAKRLEMALEGRASAYRIGGDEFCVLSAAGAEHGAVAELAAAALAESGEGFRVSASFGAVLLPNEATIATEALREADRRMYAHKLLAERGRAPGGQLEQGGPDEGDGATVLAFDLDRRRGADPR